MVFGNLFRRKPDLAALEKLELPELPQLTTLDKKKKGKKAKVPVAAYLSYVSVDKHEADMKRLTTLLEEMQRQAASTEHSLRDYQHDLSGITELRKEIDSLKKVKFAGIQELRKDTESLMKLQQELVLFREEKPIDKMRSELQEMWDELEAIRGDVKGKKATKDLQAQLSKLEADVQLLQKQMKKASTEELKSELQKHVKSLVMQHVFESRYDPKQFKIMKKDVLSFISKSMDAGHSEEKVKNALISKGWPEQLVDSYYDSVYQEKLK